jgi:hypothetical protein
MSAIFGNLIKKFGKQIIYVVAGVLLDFLMKSIVQYHPEGQMQVMVWTYAFIPLFTGLIAVLKRVMTWNPSKV